jgi:hypothetical protein
MTAGPGSGRGWAEEDGVIVAVTSGMGYVYKSKVVLAATHM